MPVGIEFPKVPTHWMMLEKLQELFPEMVEGVQWDLVSWKVDSGMSCDTTTMMECTVN